MNEDAKPMRTPAWYVVEGVSHQFPIQADPSRMIIANCGKVFVGSEWPAWTYHRAIRP
jgi:hypothetical protein